MLGFVLFMAFCSTISTIVVYVLMSENKLDEVPCLSCSKLYDEVVRLNALLGDK